MYRITTNGGEWKAKTCNGQTPQPRQMSPAQELDEKQADQTSAKSPTRDEDPPRKIAPVAPLEGAGIGGNDLLRAMTTRPASLGPIAAKLRIACVRASQGPLPSAAQAAGRLSQVPIASIERWTPWSKWPAAALAVAARVRVATDASLAAGSPQQFGQL